jgi:hypothetical protein
MPELTDSTISVIFGGLLLFGILIGWPAITTVLVLVRSEQLLGGSTGTSLWHATRLGPALSQGAEPPLTQSAGRATDRRASCCAVVASSATPQRSGVAALLPASTSRRHCGTAARPLPHT